ncbi:hypothetical protein CYMTET_41236 [Cymbomonas tetramitiformis]|uniref:Glycosyltransferase n=1 Tax=Cymbomonas tetramitiformis TaxID=36881 RepID=A0AAE0C6K0_9CHLO|nr:hypothetical protein CYMTET_41236 [Cymbomonas tetramitiformis]
MSLRRFFPYSLFLLAQLGPLAGASRSAIDNLHLPSLFSKTGVHETRKASSLHLKSVGIFHVFHPPPWGGGNQFLMALRAELQHRHVEVLDNQIAPHTTRVYMANAITFKTEPFAQAMKKIRRHDEKLKLVHRLDGPYYCSRYGKDPRKEPKIINYSEDNRVYQINHQFACASIFQSKWSLEMNRLLGYKPKEPVTVIPNAVNGDIFHNRSRREWDPYLTRQVRVLSSAWANNERKGFKTYQWLDQHLPWGRYKYTYIGNLADGYSYDNIETLPPVTSEELAPLLRDHDIYIAASYLEPCSNALLEAMASGMPVIYQKGSGHDELVKEAGLGYDVAEEIPDLLEKMVANYAYYQARINILNIKQVTDMYLKVYDYCLSH